MSTSMSDLAQGVDVLCAAAHALRLQFKVSLIEASEAVLLKMPVARPQEQDPDFSGEDKFQAMKASARRTQNLEATMTSDVGKNSVTLDSRIAERTTTIVENAYTIVKDYGSSLVQDTVRSAQEPLTTLKTKSSGCQGESVWYDETTDGTSWEECSGILTTWIRRACLLCWSSRDGGGTSRRHSRLWTISRQSCRERYVDAKSSDSNLTSCAPTT